MKICLKINEWPFSTVSFDFDNRWLLLGIFLLVRNLSSHEWFLQLCLHCLALLLVDWVTTALPWVVLFEEDIYLLPIASTIMILMMILWFFMITRRMKDLQVLEWSKIANMAYLRYWWFIELLPEGANQVQTMKHPTLRLLPEIPWEGPSNPASVL